MRNRFFARRHPDWLIIITGSSEASATAAAQEMGLANVEASALALSSLEAVASFAAALQTRFETDKTLRLAALLCNAGMSNTMLQLSKDGYEMTFAVNHLGHFLLVKKLLPLMERDSSRLINVSSDTHDPAKKTGLPSPDFVSPRDLLFTSTTNPPASFDSQKAYTSSKLCNVLFTYHLNKLLQERSSNVTVNAYNPGFIPSTGLKRNQSAVVQFLMVNVLQPILSWRGVTSSLERSCGFLSRLVDDDVFANVSGKYFDIDIEGLSSEMSHRENLQKELWDLYEELTSSI
ncbi:hypothetical protein HDU98_012117 [Podochytrium sp. JEL0797]|nr:hypothetical protein HDU98_012117 [Podochytrium sp. JEL0797]